MVAKESGIHIVHHGMEVRSEEQMARLPSAMLTSRLYGFTV